MREILFLAALLRAISVLMLVFALALSSDSRALLGYGVISIISEILYLSVVVSVMRLRQEQKAHTHSTLAGLEDGIAIAVDILNELYTSQTYVRGRAKNLVDVLSLVRRGPHAYDPDRPAGQRFRIKRREE